MKNGKQPIHSPIQLIICYLTEKENRYGVSELLLQQIRNIAITLRLLLPYKQIRDNTVLFLHEGDTSCDRKLAYIRAIQLEMQQAFGETFFLRPVIINWHPGEHDTPICSIKRNNLTSSFYDDPLVEFATICNNEVVPFSPTKPFSPIDQSPPRDQLIAGIHAHGIDIGPVFYEPDAPAFYNRLHKIFRYPPSVTILATRDLTDKILPETQLPAPALEINAPENLYFFDLTGTNQTNKRSNNLLDRKLLPLFAYATLFDFTEQRQCNPALLAHIRGLKAEKLEENTYSTGFHLYIEKSYGLMRKKGYDEQLINEIRQHYQSPDILQRVRGNIERFALIYHGITKEHFACMVYRPFVNKGARLHEFLRCEYPDLQKHEKDIHRLLADNIQAAQGGEALEEQLRRMSGLKIPHLQALYQQQS